MGLFRKKIIWGVLLSIPLVAGFAVWSYVDDLHSRFPDMDFSEARIGIASWYSETDSHINERTASGEKFNDKIIACASWDYPFGEKLLVINALNGKWVVCRVNDRGPGKRLRRKIDLTKAAFKKIADQKTGLIPVMIIRTAGKKK